MKSRAIQKPELTEEEKRQPYAKYLNRQPATPAKEALEYLRSRQEIPVEDALLAENGNMNDILKDGYMKCGGQKRTRLCGTVSGIRGTIIKPDFDGPVKMWEKVWRI